MRKGIGVRFGARRWPGALAGLAILGPVGWATNPATGETQLALIGGSGSRTSVNGFPAAIAGFQAESRNGPIRGIAAFIEYGGDVYQILGYAAASSYASHEGTFERTIRVFDRLTDRSVLAVEPRRIDLVRVDGRIDLGSFASRYATSADVETLSLINGVPEAGTLDPGTWKRVVGETPRVGG